MRARVANRQIGLQVVSGMLCILLALAGWAAGARAATHPVLPGDGSFSRTLAAAAPGDELVLQPGLHSGPLTINKPIILTGAPGAVIDGGGRGHGAHVVAPDVTLRALTVINSGRDLSKQHAGIFLGREADRARVEGNTLRDNLIGVYVWGPRDAIVRANHITGLQLHRVNARGNGIQLWRTPGSVVEDNQVFHGRDGIFVNSSKKNSFTNNLFRDLRFAVHYMYADNSEVSGNVSIGNHLGYAVMFSTRVKVTDNVSLNDRDHGVMLNYANKSIITGNVIKNTKGKCTFLYNSHKNDFSGNWFEGCGIGIHFTAGSGDNRMVGNAFLNNRTQVKYVSTKWVEWSEDGQGNYWSDFAAYDVDGDGIADTPYRPNDSMDHVLWTQPAAKMLLGSPAVQLVRWSQASFPALLPGGVMDSHALMAPALPEANKKVPQDG